MSGGARPPLVLLLGPTAAGKTALACALAERLGAEVVSADSQQCYRGLDAGTAKPGPAELSRAPHHLLDVAWPEEQLDAAAFVARADAAINGVAARGRRVLVAGGTGLWVRALCRGLVDAPGADAGFRAGFRARVAREGLPALHAELGRVDPAAAAAILPGDRVRIERALEVHALWGRPLSALQAQHRFAARRYRARVVRLDPPGPLLRARIEARTRALFAPPAAIAPALAEGPPGAPAATAPADARAAPIIAETLALLARIERVPEARKALRIIGYGEAAEAVAAGLSAAALAGAQARTAVRTRQYARRQRTWFSKDAPALDESGAPIVLADPAAACAGPGLEQLCAALAAWYESAR